MAKKVYSERVKNSITKGIEKGMTYVEIADFLSVTERAIYKWLNNHPDLQEAVEEAKKRANKKVEAALFHRAIGYKADAVKVFFDSKSGETVEHQYVHQYPPDTQAAIMWLKNRDPDNWKDKTEVANTHSFGELSDDDLDRMIKEKEKALRGEK